MRVVYPSPNSQHDPQVSKFPLCYLSKAAPRYLTPSRNSWHDISLSTHFGRKHARERHPLRAPSLRRLLTRGDGFVDFLSYKTRDAYRRRQVAKMRGHELGPSRGAKAVSVAIVGFDNGGVFLEACEIRSSTECNLNVLLCMFAFMFFVFLPSFHMCFVCATCRCWCATAAAAAAAIFFAG